MWASLVFGSKAKCVENLRNLFPGRRNFFLPSSHLIYNTDPHREDGIEHPGCWLKDTQVLCGGSPDQMQMSGPKSPRRVSSTGWEPLQAGSCGRGTESTCTFLGRDGLGPPILSQEFPH